MALSPLARPFDRNPQQRRAQRAQFDATSNFDCTDRLGEITAPTLIINGTSDHIAPLTTQRERVVREVTEFLS